MGKAINSSLKNRRFIVDPIGLIFLGLILLLILAAIVVPQFQNRDNS